MQIIKNNITLILILVLLISIIGCGTHTKQPSFLFFRKLFAPTVIFIIPNTFIDANKERIYLIHDEKNGINPPKNDGYYTYFFNTDGILKIRNYESWLLKDTIIKAFNADQEALWVKRIGYQTGRSIPSISGYVIATTEENCLKYFQNSNSDHRDLDLQVEEIEGTGVGP